MVEKEIIELDVAPKAKKQKNGLERILVWDKFMETIELSRLLAENMPSGFTVEDSHGSSDDYPLCTILSDYDILPVMCDDARAGDRHWWKHLAYAAPPSFSDYGAILARISNGNVAYVLPRLLWTQERKPDVALFLYTDDVADLKKPLSQRFQWIADRIGLLDKHGFIYSRKQIVAQIKDKSLFKEISEEHRNARVLLVEPNPIHAAQYEGIILGRGRLVPYISSSIEETVNSARDYGIILANIDREDWKTFARQVNETAPESRLVFYDGRPSIASFPFCFTQSACINADGFDAVFLGYGDVTRLLQYGALDKITQREDLRRDLKKAGVFDSLKRLETEGTSEDKFFYDLKERINPSK